LARQTGFVDRDVFRG